MRQQVYDDKAYFKQGYKSSKEYNLSRSNLHAVLILVWQIYEESFLFQLFIGISHTEGRVTFFKILNQNLSSHKWAGS